MISKRAGALIEGMKQWMSKTEVVSGYVFEPQRKAAIGYFQVRMCRKGEGLHVATLSSPLTLGCIGTVVSVG